MTTTPTTIAPPPGARFVDDWGTSGDNSRVILGDNHTVTGSHVLVSTACAQHLDGHIDDGSTGNQSPSIYLDSNPEVGLNSDQARELAALLLELAAHIDLWVTR